jgi:hypothetical protein
MIGGIYESRAVVTSPINAAKFKTTHLMTRGFRRNPGQYFAAMTGKHGVGAGFEIPALRPG